MPLTLTRAATVLSLSQLAAEAEGPTSSPQPPKGKLSTPEKAVRDVGAGASLLPLYSFPSADGFQAKRVRSFGSFQDLAAAGSAGSAVPDVDDGCVLGAGPGTCGSSAPAAPGACIAGRTHPCLLWGPAARMFPCMGSSPATGRRL